MTLSDEFWPEGTKVKLSEHGIKYYIHNCGIKDTVIRYGGVRTVSDEFFCSYRNQIVTKIYANDDNFLLADKIYWDKVRTKKRVVCKLP